MTAADHQKRNSDKMLLTSSATWDEKSELRERAFQVVVFGSLVLSGAAIVCLLVAIPLVNQYISGLHHQLNNDLRFCHVNAEDIIAFELDSFLSLFICFVRNQNFAQRAVSLQHHR